MLLQLSSIRSYLPPPFKKIRLRKLLFFIKSVLLLLLTGCYFLIERIAQDRVYSDTESIPHNEVGLVLGTSKYTREGKLNPFFQHRIEAAVELYYAGKINYILVSGDNNTKYYNEPRDMRSALIEQGVPKAAIYMDFAGFRTLDSIIRCNKVFGQRRFTVISQDFHTKRAIYLSEMAGLQAIGFNAHDVSLGGSLKVKARELLARVKALIDVHVLESQPKFLGKPIQIGQV